METKKIKPEDFSVEELEEILKRKREQKQKEALERREAYEGLRDGLLNNIEGEVCTLGTSIGTFYDMLVTETKAFYSIMLDYGQLRNGSGQMNYKIRNGRFMIEVRTNKVKKFDERADVAAERLIGFLRDWIKSSERGAEDTMYQLAMTLLERNRYGDLDYKSISKLYGFEAQFGSDEYSSIMQLFRESNVVEGTETNFYFYRKTDMGIWRKIEISFNRM
ncbi:MAG: DUF3164 family protein [Tannerella sp.]|jgi:hypothetical protein|nr:DUF3164 family protein [Tannerella sp.]